MSGKTKIEWTDAVWNPVTGCTKVSAGCKNCYAERFAQRWWGKRKFTDVRVHPDRLDQPLRWRKPRRVFVNSMSDLFHESVPDEFITCVFAVMAASPLHTFQILTKRPKRMSDWLQWLDRNGGLGRYIRNNLEVLRGFFNIVARTEIYRGTLIRSSDDPWTKVFNAAACIGSGPLHNAWLGVSCEDQATADERIPLLLQTPAAVRFVSAEPLLGPVRLSDAWRNAPLSNGSEKKIMVGLGDEIHWVICGGESGPGARPMHPDWPRSLRDQCQVAGVPFFFKQWGEYLPASQGGKSSNPITLFFNGDWDDKDSLVSMSAGMIQTHRGGKKRAGWFLDGREWNEFPG